MPRATKRVDPGTPLTNPTGAAVVATAEAGRSGEGFYQGLVGRKTGRAAPRPQGHGRSTAVPRHEAILAAHGLMDQGAADPRQGQLFAPHELPPLISPATLAKKHNAPPPLPASRPGFMPELYEKEGGGTVSTKQAHKRMVAGIQRLGAYVDVDPDSGLGAVGTAMSNRAATAALHPEPAPWYAKVTRRSTPAENPNQGVLDLDAGSATTMIESAAHGEGVSYGEMSRATAITSPRTRWTKGTLGTDDYSTPNLTSARNVVHDVKQAKAVSEELDLPVDYHEIGRHATSGGALQEHMGKAGVEFATGDPSRAIPIGELQSTKVPNFNQSLLLAHPSQAIRRQSALSYTVDTHDVSSLGAHPDMLKTMGGMAIARMTGRRSALRGGELPPAYQSRVWEGQKSKEPEPLGEHSLLETTRSGKIRPNPTQLPGHISHQFDDRSPIAKRLGLEF